MENNEKIETVEETNVEYTPEMLVEKAISLITSKEGEGVLLYRTEEAFYALPITKEPGKFSDAGHIISNDTFNLFLSWIYSSPVLQTISRQLEMVNTNLISIGMELFRKIDPNIKVSTGVNSPSGLVLPKSGMSIK